MKKQVSNTLYYIVTLVSVAMFFSCEDTLKDVQKFKQNSFFPIGEADTVHLIYTDSGKVKSTLKSPKMLDYSQIKNPYTEFPKGVLVTILDGVSDTTTIKADYAISYKKTDIIDLQGNVVISSNDGKKLMTSQLYFDQKNEWFFTEKYFKFTDAEGSYLEGPGVDFSKDFKIFNTQNSKGEVYSKDE
jgi:LPS export ABC transporter protein LptC